MGATLDILFDLVPPPSLLVKILSKNQRNVNLEYSIGSEVRVNNA